jgi:hypothetical protein
MFRILVATSGPMVQVPERRLALGMSADKRLTHGQVLELALMSRSSMIRQQPSQEA